MQYTKPFVGLACRSELLVAGTGENKSDNNCRDRNGVDNNSSAGAYEVDE